MLKTTYTSFGPVRYDESTVIRIEDGLLGFPDDKDFILIEHGSHGQLGYLQSLTTPALAFAVMDGAVLAPEYPGRDPSEIGTAAGLGDGDVAMLVLVVDDAETNALQVNLAAPIVINLDTRSGAQVMFDTRFFPHRFALTTTAKDELRAPGTAQADVA